MVVVVGCADYVPVLDWLPSYSLSNFVGDLTAAFTMTSLIVPQAMSYATNLAKLCMSALYSFPLDCSADE